MGIAENRKLLEYFVHQLKGISMSQSLKRSVAPGYDAFISYSQRGDARLAVALETHLEKFAKPWYRRKSANICRDETSLAAPHDIWEEIKAKLDASAYLILLASSLSAESKWVRREICYWITNGKCEDPSELMLDTSLIEAARVRCLILVVTEGSIAWDERTSDFDWPATTALSRDVLSQSYRGEPLWVDLRSANANPARKLDRTNETFFKAVVRLSSEIRKLDIEVLIGEDYRQHRGTIRLFSGLSIGLAGLLIVASLLSWFAYAQWNQAEKNLGDVHFQNARRSLRSDGDINTGVLWLGETLLTAGTNAEATRSAARTLIGAWRNSLPNYSLLQEEPIFDAEWSPDGKTIATRSRRVVKFWNSETGSARGSTMEHDEEISALTFSPDSKLIGTATRNLFTHEGNASLWHTDTGRLHAKLVTGSEVYRIKFSPDGLVVATCGVVAELFSSVTGESLHEPLTQEGDVDHIEFSPDGKTIFTASSGLKGESEGEFCVWDVETGKLRGKPVHHEGVYPEIVFSKSGRFFATSYGNRGVRIWNTDAGRPIGKPLRNILGRVEFGPDDNTVRIRTKDGNLETWKLMPKEVVKVNSEIVKRARSNGVKPISEDDRSEATSLKAKIVKTAVDRGPLGRYNIDRTKAFTISDGVVQVRDAASYDRTSSILQHEDSIGMVAYSPNGKKIAAELTGGAIVIWDLRSRKQIGKPLKTDEPVRALAFANDSRNLFTADDGAFCLWDGQTGERKSECSFVFASDVTHVVISADQELAATAASVVPQGGFEPPTGYLSLCSLAKDEFGMSLDASISDVAFSPDGTMVASAWDDNVIRITTLRALKTQSDVSERPQTNILASAGAMAFQPHSALLATASTDIVRFWNVKTGKQVGDQLLLAKPALKLLFSPNGRLLVAISASQAELWHLKTRTPFGEALRHPLGISAIAFRPDGRELAIASGKQIWFVAIQSQSEEPRHIVLSVEVRTAKTIQEGVVRLLTELELAQRKSELMKLGGDCLGSSMQSQVVTRQQE